MATSLTRTFLDPEELVTALRPASIEHTITEPGNFSAEFTGIEFDRIWIRQGTEHLARVARVELPPERTLLGFLPAAAAGIFIGGVELQRNMIVQHGTARTYYQRILGPTIWGNISIENETMAAIGAAAEIADPLARDSQTYLPSASSIRALMRLLQRSVAAAREAPQILANPGAAAGLENALIDSVTNCLGDVDRQSVGVANRNHELIMSRFNRLLAEYDQAPLFMPEVAQRLNIPARTLRACCEKHLGMGPKQFSTVRRLNQVRRALSRTNRSDTNVTQTATNFGFWELGRFAVAYREMFGESPSATLRKRLGGTEPAKPTGGCAAQLRKAYAAPDQRLWQLAACMD